MSKGSWYRGLGGMRPAARSYVGSGIPARAGALRGRRFRVLRNGNYPDAAGQVGECREAFWDSRRQLFLLELIMPGGWALTAAACDVEESE